MAEVTSKLNPLVDADIIAYRCAWAAEGEPLEFVLSTVRHYMDHVLEQFPGRSYFKNYLTGSNNYRVELAKQRVYKGSRKDKPKPAYLQEIRDYLIRNWDAEVIDGREADDALGCEQWAHPDKSTVIVTIDKDLDMIPGYHYNPVKKKLYYVTKPVADRKFFTQILVGDSVDDIPGLKGCGPKGAAAIVRDGMTWNEMLGAVTDAYTKQYPYTAPEIVDEMANLVWIQREEGVLWSGRNLEEIQRKLDENVEYNETLSEQRCDDVPTPTES